MCSLNSWVLFVCFHQQRNRSVLSRPQDPSARREDLLCRSDARVGGRACGRGYSQSPGMVWNAFIHSCARSFLRPLCSFSIIACALPLSLRLLVNCLCFDSALRSTV